MKRLLVVLLAVAMLLSMMACGKTAEAPATTETPTTAPATEAVTEPATEAPTEPETEPATEPATEAPTEPETEPAPVYTNPLTGEVVEAPMDQRLFVVSINNLEAAMPHVGVVDADIYMEMFVNSSIIRGLALYSDVSKVDVIGPVRSNRLMFIDIASHYDTIIAHAGGSKQVRAATAALGLDNFNIDHWDECNYSFRDKERTKAGYGYEHTLFAKGSGLVEYAVEKGYEVTRDPETDYRLTFAEDGTPADGEAAETINITFSYNGSRKDTIMEYDPELGQYVYYQYNMKMVDGKTGEAESYENVVIMMTKISLNGMYHVADFVAGGEGYFACGGKLIPMKWYCDSEDSPFYFTTMDGEPLDLGVGRTYIAIAPVNSPITWSAAEAAAE